MRSALTDATVRIQRAERETEAARALAQPRAGTTIAIPPDKLVALIKLAHPDRHGNSALATETTQWLLSMRGSRTRAA